MTKEQFLWAMNYHTIAQDMLYRNIVGVERRQCEWCDNEALVGDKLCQRCYDFYEKHQYDD